MPATAAADFEVWLTHPDGTGLHKLISNCSRNNHPHFLPDGRWLVFTSKAAPAYRAEGDLPRRISLSPYGELFAVRLDGSGLIRLTHNGFEEGTPARGPGARDCQGVERRGQGVSGAEDY